MPIWLVAFLLLAYLAAPFVEFRLWRAGKLSDRAATVLLLARLPILLGVLAFASGRFPDPIQVAGVAVIASLGYSWLPGAVRKRGRELRSTRS
jgi:hypothetical protein